MKNEDAILAMLQQNNEFLHSFKDDVNRRFDEIYIERKNIQIRWFLPFVGFNAGVAACVAFFVTLWK